MAILEVERLKKRFGSTDVLKDISFTMEKGSVLSVLGSSGSGKTTLLRCLNFLEKPDGGKIRVDGQLLLDASRPDTMTEEEIRQNRLHFGMVFQNFNLFPQYTALKNVMLAPLLAAKARPDNRAHKKEIQERIEAEALALLDKVGLSDRSGNYPHQLSGGQQQRVAIARALAKNPKLLLCDEPTGALDYVTGKNILKLLQDTCRRTKMTVVIITHNSALTAMADRVISIKNGTIQSMHLNEHATPVEQIEW